MTRQKGANLLHYYVSKQVFSWRAKTLIFYAFLEEKQVFSWHAKNVQICCIITWKSRFSHNAPKTFIFHVLFRGKAGFLMTRQKFVILLRFKAGFLMTPQKLLYLMHYYVEKQVFSWRAKKCKFVALLLGKAGFLITRQKTLLFHVLLHGKAGFLMTLKKGANLWHYYVEKEVFSWRAKKSYILCIFTWKSRFSHDTPKRCKFVALLRFEAGFLMTLKKGANL